MIEPINNFTTTATTAGVTLSSIPGTYKHLMLVCNIKASAGNTDIGIQLNGDTGSTQYGTHMMYGNSAGVGGSYRTTRASLQISNWSYSDSVEFNQSITYFHNYANTNLWKTHNFKSVRGNSGGGVDVGQGHWKSTAAITSMYIYGFPNSFATGCTFSLYGII